MAHGTAAVKVGKLGDLLLAVWKNYLLLMVVNAILWTFVDGVI